MVQIYIVNNDDKYEMDNINVFSSIYNLKQKFKNTYNKRIKINNIKTNKELLNKIKNNDFYFTYKGQRLEDDKTLYQYNIKNSEMININYTLPGGSIGSTLSGGMTFIESLIGLLIFYITLSSGFISFIAKIYGYSLMIVLEKLLNFIYWFFGENVIKKSSINSSLKFIENLVIYLAIAGYVYVYTYYQSNITFNKIFFESKCKSLKNAKTIALITTTIFVMLYIMIQIPEFILDFFAKITSFISSKTSNKFKIFSNVINKSTELGKEGFESVKFVGLYMLPVFGNTFEYYHRLLQTIFKGVNTVRKKLTTQNAESGKKRIIDCKKDDVISILASDQDFINMLNKSNGIKAGQAIKFYRFLLDVSKESYDDIISDKKISDEDRYQKLTIKFIYYMICNLLKLVSFFSDSLDYIGSSTDIINMIMSSSISGSISSFIHFVSVLIAGIISLF